MYGIIDSSNDTVESTTRHPQAQKPRQTGLPKYRQEPRRGDKSREEPERADKKG